MIAPSIDLKLGKVFPFQFQFLAYLFLVMGAALLFVNFAPAIVLLFLGGLVTTGFSGSQFDIENKKHRSYNSFLWVRFGRWHSTKEVEKIYINKINTSQKMYSRANLSTTVKGYIYKCFIKFTDGEKMLILENKNKDHLIATLQPLTKNFDLPVQDNTE